jgi:hypothetical protein
VTSAGKSCAPGKHHPKRRADWARRFFACAQQNRTVTAPIRLDMAPEIALTTLCVTVGAWQILASRKGKILSDSKEIRHCAPIIIIEWIKEAAQIPQWMKPEIV